MADEIVQESSGSGIINFLHNEHIGKSLSNNSFEEISCTEGQSPLKATSHTRILSRLNLDIPEDENYDKIHPNDGDIKEINNSYDLKLSRHTLPTSEQLKLLISNQEKHTNIDMTQQIAFCIDNKLSQSKFDNRMNYFYCQDINSLSASLFSNKSKYNTNSKVDDIAKFEEEISPSKAIVTRCNSPKIKIPNNIESHISMNISSIVPDNLWTDNNLSFKLQWWKVPFAKFYEFGYWLPNKTFKFMKTNFRRFYQIFVSILPKFPTMKSTTADKPIDDLTQVTSIIQTENEKLLMLFTEKLNNITQELNQVHMLNETTLSVLKCELDSVKKTSNQLAHNSNTLTRELTVISKKLDDTIKINSTTPSRLSGSILTSGTQPPPPPPPPPLPPSIPITSNNQIHNKTSRTPTRKCFTPLTAGRPVITVEDLRKVTLKKAPQTNKENNSKNNVQPPYGPAISLEMLRSVKLKSTRHSRSNADVKNMKSPRRTFKNCGTQSFSISPITTGTVSPLSRILKRDSRHRLKRALMSPTHSDNDLTKDNPKQFDVARQNKSSHTIIV